MLNIGKKLRAARKKQDLSLRELASMADVSASLLSQIENGRANPSVESLFSIATALSVPVHYFFPYSESKASDASGETDNGRGHEDGEQELALSVEMTSGQLRASQEGVGTSVIPQSITAEDSFPGVRATERATIQLMGGVKWARLTPHKEKGIEFLEVEYEVGGTSGPARSRHSGSEFGLVLEGTLKLELGFEEYLLEEGDSIIFNSAVPHRLSNAGNVPLRAIWVNIAHR